MTCMNIYSHILVLSIINKKEFCVTLCLDNGLGSFYSRSTELTSQTPLYPLYLLIRNVFPKDT